MRVICFNFQRVSREIVDIRILSEFWYIPILENLRRVLMVIVRTLLLFRILKVTERLSTYFYLFTGFGWSLLL